MSSQMAGGTTDSCPTTHTCSPMDDQDGEGGMAAGAAGE